MDEGRELALKNAKYAIRRIQEFSHKSGSSDDVHALDRLADVCSRLEKAGVDQLTREECEDFFEAMTPVLIRLRKIEAEDADREESASDGGLHPVTTVRLSVHSIKKQCDAAFPVASDFAERAINRAGFKRVEGELAGIKEARAQSSAAQQSNFFKTTAKGYEIAAAVWGGLVLLLVGVLAWVAWESLNSGEDIKSWPAFARAWADRVLLFAALGYGVFFCAKNCFANYHNAVVNRHRQNAVETYLEIARVVTDEKHRSTFLSYAAQCIYVPQDSGFAKGNSESGISADTILRLARGKISG